MAKGFALSDAKNNASRLLDREGIADLALLRIISAIWEKKQPENQVSGMWWNLLITSLSELYFRFKRFILLVQTKKEISMNNGSITSSWKSWWWVRFDLILTMRDIYIYIYQFHLNSLTKITSSIRSTEFKDILPWNVSQMITKTIWINLTIVISYVMKRGILF